MFSLLKMRLRFPVYLRLLCGGAFLCGMGGLRAQEPAAASPAPLPSKPGAVREVANIPYVSNGHESQQLDLYLPGKDGPLRPLVVWVHGGAWEAGSKKSCPMRPLAQRGYVVASLEYRLSSQAKYPAQIEDCKAAVRWLRAHASEYGIDPRHVGAGGDSAGGHLAALLGTTGGTRRFDVGENLDQSSAVQCVLDWYGPTDFLCWGDPPLTAFSDRPDNPPARLLGGTITTHLELARAASPVYFVDAHCAPFLIMHGDQDSTVPLQQSQELHAALTRAGVESTLKVLPGAGHGGAAFGTPENRLLIADFFDRHLLSVPPPAAP